MKTRRLFQVASGMLALIFGVALFAIAVLTILPFFVDLPFGNEGILKDFHQGAIAVAESVPFLQLEGNLGAIVYVLAAYLFPALLLILAAILMFGKRKKSQVRYYFADALIILSSLTFAVLFVMFAEKLFGNERAIAWIIGACAGAFLLLFLVFVSLRGKKSKSKTQKADEGGKKPKEKAVKAKKEDKKSKRGAETDVQHDVSAQTATTDAQPSMPQQPEEDVTESRLETVSEQMPFEPEQKREEKPAKKPVERQYEESPGTQYIPRGTSSISDIVAQTYGGAEEKPRKNNWAKIEKLRSLLEDNIITRDEYTALVNAYLKEEQE